MLRSGKFARRLGRIPLNTLTMTSLLSCTAFIAFWVRSNWASDLIARLQELVATVTSVVRVRSWRRRSILSQHGLCTNCGYDLRHV